MSYLNIHTRPLHNNKGRVGRPWKRKRRTAWYKKNLKKKNWSMNQPSVLPKKENEQHWLEVMDQYALAFEDICKSFVAGYYRNEAFLFSSWAGKIVYEKILSLSKQHFSDMPRDLEMCDVANRLRLIWYQAVVRYDQRSPSVPFRNYLFRMSLFELEHWMESIKPMDLPYWEESTCIMDIDNEFDVHWLMSDKSKLSVYEKILLFYKYTLELSDIDIAKTLGCARSKLIGDLRRLKKKLAYTLRGTPDDFWACSRAS